MTDIIDRVHFEDLIARDPKEVCRRAKCGYNETAHYYELRVWSEPYHIFPDQFRIEYHSKADRGFHEYFSLFVIHYLLGAKEIEPSGEWISEKDIPGGTTFFRGPHEIQTHLITSRFENNVHEFSKQCSRLHGTSLAQADAAYCFEITPRIPVAVLYWKGDDEFPAESKILYDRTVSDHLASDIVYALAIGICHRLGKAGD